MNLNKLLSHTRLVFEANNVKTKLDNIKTFDEFRSIIDSVWGWHSDNTLYLLDGYYRSGERSKDKIITK